MPSFEDPPQSEEADKPQSDEDFSQLQPPDESEFDWEEYSARRKAAFSSLVNDPSKAGFDAFTTDFSDHPYLITDEAWGYWEEAFKICQTNTSSSAEMVLYEIAGIRSNSGMVKLFENYFALLPELAKNADSIIELHSWFYEDLKEESEESRGEIEDGPCKDYILGTIFVLTEALNATGAYDDTDSAMKEAIDRLKISEDQVQKFPETNDEIAVKVCGDLYNRLSHYGEEKKDPSQVLTFLEIAPLLLPCEVRPFGRDKKESAREEELRGEPFSPDRTEVSDFWCTTAARGELFFNLREKMGDTNEKFVILCGLAVHLLPKTVRDSEVAEFCEELVKFCNTHKALDLYMVRRISSRSAYFVRENSSLAEAKEALAHFERLIKAELLQYLPAIWPGNNWGEEEESSLGLRLAITERFLSKFPLCLSISLFREYSKEVGRILSLQPEGKALDYLMEAAEHPEELWVKDRISEIREALLEDNFADLDLEIAAELLCVPFYDPYQFLKHETREATAILRKAQYETTEGLSKHFEPVTVNVRLREDVGSDQDNLKHESEKILEDLNHCYRALIRGEESPHDSDSAKDRFDPSVIRKSIFWELMHDDKKEIHSLNLAAARLILSAEIPSAESLLRFMLHSLEKEILKHTGYSGEEQLVADSLFLRELHRSLRVGRKSLAPKDSRCPVRFEFTRGVLVEFVGFICETCLTEKRNIRKKKPNAFFVPFIALREGYEWFAGGSVVLEAETQTCRSKYKKDKKTKTKVEWKAGKSLVIRGFNPTLFALENQNIHPGALFEEFLTSLIEIAEKINSDPDVEEEDKIQNIVIPWDERALVTQTNSPEVNKYLREQYPKFELMLKKFSDLNQEDQEERRKLQVNFESAEDVDFFRGMSRHGVRVWDRDKGRIFPKDDKFLARPKKANTIPAP